jgi:hypothetical protein
MHAYIGHDVARAGCAWSCPLADLELDIEVACAACAARALLLEALDNVVLHGSRVLVGALLLAQRHPVSERPRRQTEADRTYGEAAAGVDTRRKGGGRDTRRKGGGGAGRGGGGGGDHDRASGRQVEHEAVWPGLRGPPRAQSEPKIARGYKPAARGGYIQFRRM